MVPFFYWGGISFFTIFVILVQEYPPKKRGAPTGDVPLFGSVEREAGEGLPAHVTCMFYRLITFMALPLFTFTK